jgi:hypothetical protein
VQNTQVRQFQLVDFTALLAGGTPTLALPADKSAGDVEELECTGAGIVPPWPTCAINYFNWFVKLMR